MTDTTISEAGLERAARAVAARHYAKRFGKPASDPHVVMNANGNWGIFVDDARTAIEAYVAAVPADAAPLDHPAVRALLATVPPLPTEFLDSMRLVQDAFLDGADQLADETVLSVGRRAVEDGEEEITVVTRTAAGRLRVHGCVTDAETPTYGVNVYDDAATMVAAQDSVLDPGESWCGAYEREQFGLLAADPTAR